MSPGERLRALIEAPEIAVLPGVHDALTALVAERAGARGLVAGGYAATATLLGRPDTSQLGVGELATFYGHLCERVEVPVMADADTGFGNVTNVARAVRVIERTGVAGLFVEDQVFPKRCGHTAGKAVIATEAMLGKLKAALDARLDPEFVIMARTDAIATDGLDAALERMARYREAGAHLLFVEAPTTVEEMRRICAELDGPNFANMVEGGRTPLLPAAELQAIGYRAVTMPVAMTHAVAKLAQTLYGRLLARGDLRDVLDLGLAFDAYADLVGLPEERATEQHYLDLAEGLSGARRSAR